MKDVEYISFENSVCLALLSYYLYSRWLARGHHCFLSWTIIVAIMTKPRLYYNHRLFAKVIRDLISIHLFLNSLISLNSLSLYHNRHSHLHPPLLSIAIPALANKLLILGILIITICVDGGSWMGDWGMGGGMGRRWLGGEWGFGDVWWMGWWWVSDIGMECSIVVTEGSCPWTHHGGRNDISFRAYHLENISTLQIFPLRNMHSTTPSLLDPSRNLSSFLPFSILK